VSEQHVIYTDYPDENIFASKLDLKITSII
jgi:hypothetical protein